MSPGILPVIKETFIEDDLRTQLLDHPFFYSAYDFKLQEHLILEGPTTEYDSLILQFLDKMGIDYSGKVIEYWFQHQRNDPRFNVLGCHCDYNYVLRNKMKLEGDDWPHKVARHLISSPITIAVYLEVTDLVGGELCISNKTWPEYTHPIAIEKSREILEEDYQVVNPEQGKVLFFKGSEHYHWINTVTHGVRKSLLINFWPPEVFDIPLL